VLIIKYVMTYRENILDKHFRQESFGFDSKASVCSVYDSNGCSKRTDL
jgi:hypothetical protein